MRHSISTRKYEFAHGRAPKGTGTWAFDIDRYVQYADGGREETTTVFAPRSMFYTEAKRWVRHNVAGERDIVTIHVAT